MAGRCRSMADRGTAAGHRSSPPVVQSFNVLVPRPATDGETDVAGRRHGGKRHPQRCNTDTSDETENTAPPAQLTKTTEGTLTDRRRHPQPRAACAACDDCQAGHRRAQKNEHAKDMTCDACTRGEGGSQGPAGGVGGDGSGQRGVREGQKCACHGPRGPGAVG